MARYIASYDLRKPDYTEADYKKMYAALDTYNAKPVQDSVWACRSASTSKEIFDDIWQHMHQAKDRLLVAEFTSEFCAIHGITKLKDV